MLQYFHNLMPFSDFEDEWTPIPEDAAAAVIEHTQVFLETNVHDPVARKNSQLLSDPRVEKIVQATISESESCQPDALFEPLIYIVMHAKDIRSVITSCVELYAQNASRIINALTREQREAIAEVMEINYDMMLMGGENGDEIEEECPGSDPQLERSPYHSRWGSIGITFPVDADDPELLDGDTDDYPFLAAFLQQVIDGALPVEDVSEE